jgi:hypothetical protein
MRRLAVAILALSLVAAACGDDDAETTTQPEATSTSAASETSEVTTTTTEAMTTTTEAMTTTTADPMAAVMAELQGYAGTYTGQWNNTTFGSSGSIDWSLTIDEAAGAVVLTSDLGGGVFGGGDPDSEEFVIPLADLLASFGEVTITSPVFGELHVTAGADGTIEAHSDDVPGNRIATFTVTGTFSADGGGDFDYVVEFEGGGAPAEGTVTFTRS